MIPDRTPMSPLHQAALTVHALPAADRRWLLEALPPAQRQVIAPLLEELRELGIPADAQLLQHVRPAAPVSAAPSPLPWPEHLDAIGQEALARVLEREPPGVARHLLAMREWPWARDLATRLTATHLDLMRPASESTAPRARVSATLLEVLESLVNEELQRISPSERTTPPGVWQSVRGRVARWRRRR